MWTLVSRVPVHTNCETCTDFVYQTLGLFTDGGSARHQSISPARRGRGTHRLSSCIQTPFRVVGLFGVKVEAITDTVTILPFQPHTKSSSTAHFQLQPPSDGRSEAIFLRHGDVLGFSTAETNLVCHWTDSEVQVNSSAAANVNGVTEIHEEDTEDEDSKEPVVDATSLKQPQPQATPRLSNQRSITIVKETPTTDRVDHTPAFRDANFNPPDFANDVNKLAKYTPNISKDPEAEPEQEAAAFSTARTSELQDRARFNLLSSARVSSPQVQTPARLSKKRTLPTSQEEASEADNEALAGPSKRAKTADSDTQDSRSSNVDVAKEDLSTMPPRAQKGSQRFTSTITEDYDGPTPRVACSNSTITKTSQVIKFLKKQGGAYVENLTDEFNLLW
ncbi:hypothetical protein IG631_03508 [Alternaria alternata]|nr:hypothetical protein IG631_03508 [Alternaria alternata]